MDLIVYPRPRTKTEAKATSRALRNLERRGLIVRLKPSGERADEAERAYTSSIRLTRAGIAAAQRIEQKEAA